MKLNRAIRTRGASVVELLVAIAVIIVLASLLFAWTQSARNAALSTRCIANLRTLGAGAMAFMMDHDGFFLPDKGWYQASWDAKPGFRDYVGIWSRAPNGSAEYMVDSPFTCPAMKVLFPEKFPNFLNRGYSINMFALRYHPSSGAPLSPGRLSNIPSLSAMWLFTEALKTPAMNFGTNMNAEDVNRGRMCYPHSDRQNVVFFDGSIAALNEEMFWNRNSQGKTLFWGNAKPD